MGFAVAPIRAMTPGVRVTPATHVGRIAEEPAQMTMVVQAVWSAWAGVAAAVTHVTNPRVPTTPALPAGRIAEEVAPMTTAAEAV